MADRLLWRNLARLDDLLLGAEEIAILTDADGTLSDIRAKPGAATVTGELSSLLGSLNRLFKLVAVVSGRRAIDAQALVGREDLLYLGNHGLERLQNGVIEHLPQAKMIVETIAKAKVEIEGSLPSVPGLYLEDKEFVLTIHYRQCEDGAAVEAAQALAERVALTYGLRLQHGRRITELRPFGIDKGSAVVQLVADVGARQAIYIGDDATDIDAFTALKVAASAGASGIFSSVNIAVVGSESPPGLKSAADYWVSSVGEVRQFFSWLEERAVEALK